MMKIDVSFTFNHGLDDFPLKITVEGKESLVKEVYNDIAKILREDYDYLPL